jgi:large subunit ribosomal protein L10
MSKPVKALITANYKDKFKDLDGAVVISIRNVSSNDTNNFRAKLAAKKVKLTVVKNALAATAFKGSALEELGKLLTGSSTIAHGGESVVQVAREVIELFKDHKFVEIKAAVMDGTIFTGKQVEDLSKYPTRPEAQAQTVTIILSPAANLAGAIVGPGRKVASLIKAVEVKKSKEEGAAA